MTVRQLVLELAHRPALDREDFLVGPSNRDAVAWIDSWPDWPSGTLALFGDEGCGKTHLAHVWQRVSGASRLALEQLDEPGLPELSRPPGVALEVGDVVNEPLLLHLLNMARAEGSTVLLLSRKPPAHWPVSLRDLSSRLAAIAAIRVGPPDDALFEAILVKLFADRQVRLEPGLVAFLSRRLERSFAAASRAVAWLDRMALSEQRPPSVALARRMLTETGEGIEL